MRQNALSASETGAIEEIYAEGHAPSRNPGEFLRFTLRSMARYDMLRPPEEAHKTMTATSSLTAPQAEDRALAMPIADVAAQLVELLGYRTLGVIVGVTQARTIRLWVEGETRPPEPTDDKLRFTLQAALIIRQRFPESTVRSFFSGMNHRLGYHSPAMVIREDYREETRHAILNAASTFLTNAG